MKRLTGLMIVCSPGGHLLQMLSLSPAWEGIDVHWVTFHAPDSDSLLTEESVSWAYSPTHRNAKNFLRNLGLAVRVINRKRPCAIISTGAAIAVPFFVVGKLFGVHLIYVESITRVRRLSLTGKLVKPLADEFYVQWPGLATAGVRFAGQVV